MKQLVNEPKSLKLEDLQGLEIQDQLSKVNGGRKSAVSQGIITGMNEDYLAEEADEM